MKVQVCACVECVCVFACACACVCVRVTEHSVDLQKYPFSSLLVSYVINWTSFHQYQRIYTYPENAKLKSNVAVIFKCVLL